MTPAEFRAAVDARLAAWPDSLAFLVEDSLEEEPFQEVAAALRRALDGGKRTRAVLTFAGLSCAAGAHTPQAVSAGAALELFQASALAHDDVIDNSPLRRGQPAMHVAFERAHDAAQWVGDASAFGRAAAITLGDLLLAGASHEFERALADSEPKAAFAALTDFNRMMTEVAYGQFLDVREEHVPVDTDGPIGRALAIARHKSARYSVEYPLVIGARLGGGDARLVAALQELGLALGLAFQLRDDELGVFGDPDMTGKPSCGDIAEGKRTVLLALIRERLDGANLAFVDDCLGTPLTPQQASRIRQLAQECGARATHEDMIADFEAQAERAFASLDAHEEGKALLRAVMDELEGRRA